MAAAAQVAASTVANSIRAELDAFDRILFVCFDQQATSIFAAAVEHEVPAAPTSK